MVRLARRPDGTVAVAAHPAAGRGAYLCPVAACFERAYKRGAVSRALRLRGTSPPPLETVGAEALQALRARLARLEASGGRSEERAARAVVLQALASWCPGPDFRPGSVDAVSGVGKVAHRAQEMVGVKGGPANAHG